MNEHFIYSTHYLLGVIKQIEIICFWTETQVNTGKIPLVDMNSSKFTDPFLSVYTLVRQLKAICAILFKGKIALDYHCQ